MPIQSGDVKLLKSAIMSDAPESGGAPTGNEIADGVSNAIFPDISELDRAGGRVNLRKTFVGVQTPDTDTYFGANVIVAEPPKDPRVSVTLFSTENTFDTRAQAQSRIESYLNKGPEWPGYLYENHIAGQRVIQLFQRTTDPLPNVGQTLVLIENEGKVGHKEQYVRVTSASSVTRTFTYNEGGRAVDYQAAIVTCEISDALRYDFTGSPANRFFVRSNTKDNSTPNPDLTKLRDTVVADAGTYVGVVPLKATAAIGDFTVQADGVYTQLVPSAQTETPILNSPAYNLQNVLQPLGDAISRTESRVFTTTTSYYFGSPVIPGSVRFVASGVTVTDDAGMLRTSSGECGTIDYANGLAQLTSNVFGTGAVSLTTTFIAAAASGQTPRSYGFLVTPETRSLSYVRTLGAKIIPGTASLSYMAQGRWYVLRDGGNGKLTGNDALYGAGTINYATGGYTVTLGALPDVGSSIIFQYQQEDLSLVQSNVDLAQGGYMYFAFNTDGVEGESRGSKAISPGSLTLSWVNDGTKTATDNGNGVITGDAVGWVDYQAGVVRFAPSSLPAPGTVVTVTQMAGASATQDVTFDTSTSVNFSLPVNVVPNSVSAALPIVVRYVDSVFGFIDGAFIHVSATLRDDGLGNMYVTYAGQPNVTVGTIDYATGAVSISWTASAFAAWRLSDSYQRYTSNGSWQRVTVTATIAPDQAYLWGSTISVLYSTTPAIANPISATLNALFGRVLFMAPGWTLKGVNFQLGSERIFSTANGTLMRSWNTTTGTGTPSGVLNFETGSWGLASWPTGVSPLLSNFRGVQAPPITGTDVALSDAMIVFRTAAAPLRPGSFQITGQMSDGTSFNVTADLAGVINSARVKGEVDYERGVAKLVFVNPSPTDLGTEDVSYLGIQGVSTVNLDSANNSTIRYNAVAFSYLPLDADLLGIDPVRLPSDGRVPIFRKGGFAVVGHTGEIGPITVSNGQTINCGRVRLSRVRVIGNNGAVINTGYTADLEAGTVTFNDVSGYSQPVTIQHRIEDMGVIRDTQISGEITFTRPLTHNYPLGSYVSSALVAGDLYARVSLVFDQATWNGTFSDTPGAAATATFNNTTYPILVTNAGAITERWVVQFTNSTSFNVIGENVGVIATGNTSTNCAPLNPNTGVPYFTIPALGWGSGWATGNVLRFNTIGAMFPVWVVRTVQQGPETVPDDDFTILIRGDVNANPQ